MTTDAESAYDPNKTLVLDAMPQTGTAATVSNELRQRFYFRRVLGRGAFGIVYLAEDRRIGRLVAVKQLFCPGKDCSAEMRARFVQEAHIAGRLEHPNIIIVYDIAGNDDQAAIVMEYLGSGSLADLLVQQRKLEVRSACRIMLGILNGLQAAHAIEVVHRDIKPHNILFGIGGVPKLTDFGIAHLPAEAGGSPLLAELKRQGAITGTPLYMAPEQLLGQQVDTRADIYAAGAVFYEMLTGNTALPMSPKFKLAQLQNQALTYSPPPVRQLNADVSAAVEAIIMQMLAKDPGQRQCSSSEVMHQLLTAMTELAQPCAGESQWLNPSVQQILHTPFAILEDIIYLLLVDGVMTPLERIELNRRIEHLGLSEQEAARIEAKVRMQLKIDT